MNKYDKTFIKQYKEAKIASLILSIGSLIFIISAAVSEWTIINPIILSIGSFIFLYAFFYFFLYWKCAIYQKKNQKLPKWFRVISAILLIFYLTLFQLDKNEKTYRLYLLLKEIRFYFLTWIFLGILISVFNFQLIQKNNFLWFGISLTIITVFLLIDWTLTIFIWKYRGNKNKWLKILSIITLNYRNYRLYKEIIELNTKEKTVND